MLAHLRETLTWQVHAWMVFLQTAPRTLPSYHHAVARHSRLPKPLALLASLLVYSEGVGGGRARGVCGCQRAAAVDVSSSAPSRAQRQQHEDRSLGHRLRHTTRPTQPHPFRFHAAHPHDVVGSPTSVAERLGRRNVKTRLGCVSVLLVLTQITCLAASCSVRGWMRGDQAHGR